MIYQAPDSIIPSFALAALSVALHAEPVLGPDTLKLADRTVRMDLGYHLPIRYYGPRGSIRQFSAARVLRGDLDPNDVRGQVVLLGATAVALGDTFATPFDRGIPGVEVFATAVSNILAGDGLVRTSLIRRIDAATAILLPVVIVLSSGMRRSLLGMVLGAGVLALWVVGGRSGVCGGILAQHRGPALRRAADRLGKRLGAPRARSPRREASGAREGGARQVPVPAPGRARSE